MNAKELRDMFLSVSRGTIQHVFILSGRKHLYCRYSLNTIKGTESCYIKCDFCDLVDSVHFAQDCGMDVNIVKG